MTAPDEPTEPDDPGHLLSPEEWATVQADAEVYAADPDES